MKPDFCLYFSGLVIIICVVERLLLPISAFSGVYFPFVFPFLSFGWLAYLVCRFDYYTRVNVNARLNPLYV